MSLSVVWRASAVEDVEAAYTWYSDMRSELAERFAAEVAEAVAYIAQSPRRSAVVYRNVRRANLGRFPYALFYVARLDGVLVLACMHGKRNPEHWRSRGKT